MAEGFGPQNKEQLLSTFCIQDSGLTSTQKLPNARPEDERARAAHARRQEAEAERVAEACRMAEEDARRAFVELAERAAEDEGKKPRLEIAFAAAEDDALRRADELFSMGCSVDQIRSLYGDIILMQLRLIPRMSDVHHEVPAVPEPVVKKGAATYISTSYISCVHDRECYTYILEDMGMNYVCNVVCVCMIGSATRVYLKMCA
jgi:hypothetical protein